MSRARVLAWLMLAVATPAVALVQPPDPPGVLAWSLEPSQPTTRTFVVIRLDASGCALLSGLTAQVDRATRHVRLDLIGSDVCPQEPSARVFLAPLGYLDAGTWTIDRFGCDGPDPTQCTPYTGTATLTSFSVIDAGRARSVIPFWTPPTAGLLAALVALLAAWRLPRTA